MSAKVRCDGCKRLVGVKEGRLSKHRTGRSKPDNVKPVCGCSGKEAKKA